MAPCILEMPGKSQSARTAASRYAEYSSALVACTTDRSEQIALIAWACVAFLASVRIRRPCPWCRYAVKYLSVEASIAPLEQNTGPALPSLYMVTGGQSGDTAAGGGTSTPTRLPGRPGTAWLTPGWLATAWPEGGG